MTDPQHSSHHLQPTDGTFDFKDGPEFARSYLKTYYAQPPTEDEVSVFEFLVEDFRDHPPTGTLLELGCGPTIHHALPFAPHVSELHLADYLEENLEQVRLWKGGAPSAHDWSAYGHLALTLEGKDASNASVRQRMDMVRSKLTRTLTCDLKADTPSSEQAQYDGVGCFYCAEEIGISLDEWRKVVARAVAYLKPGGTFYMAALAGMDGYEVTDTTGASVMYPCANVHESDVSACLESLGFATSDMRLRSSSIEHPDCGVTATVLVAATLPS